MEEPKSSSKKTKTAATTGRLSYATEDRSDPDERAEDEESIGTQPEASVKSVSTTPSQQHIDLPRQTINLLQNVKLQDSSWPKVFGKRLDEDEKALLERLENRRKSV